MRLTIARCAALACLPPSTADTECRRTPMPRHHAAADVNAAAQRHRDAGAFEINEYDLDVHRQGRRRSRNWSTPAAITSPNAGGEAYRPWHRGDEGRQGLLHQRDGQEGEVCWTTSRRDRPVDRDARATRARSSPSRASPTSSDACRGSDSPQRLTGGSKRPIARGHGRIVACAMAEAIRGGSSQSS